MSGSLVALILAAVIMPGLPPPQTQNVAPVHAPPAPMHIPALIGIDQTFALAALQNNAAEMAMAQLALARSKTSEVRGFAQKMLDEHMDLASEMRRPLQRVLGAPDPKPPMGASDTLTYRHLQTVPPVDFDQVYLLAQIGGHLATMSAFQTEADNGTDPQLKMLARKWLPSIRSHFELAVDVTRHVGGDSPFKL